MMSAASSLILYKASAGSGKTYTLAKEYLKIVLLQPYDYRKILAVTFTRKATQEMKSRIIEYLSLLQQKDAKLTSLRETVIAEILQEKGTDISEQFDKNVQTALQLILHDYSNFNISTIDSFFQGIIRSFAKELDLPVGMEVELDTDYVIQQAVQAILKEYKSEKDAFSKWIEEYVFDLIEEDKSWKIEKNIAHLARQILSEEYQLLAQGNRQQFDIETYKKVLLELKQLVADYRKRLDGLTKQVEQRIQQDAVDLSLFYYGNSSVRSFIKKTKAYAPEANSYLQKMLSGGDLYSKTKVKNETDMQLLENAWNQYIVYYVGDVLALKEQYQLKYNSAEIALKNIYSLALLEFINSKIKQYKSEENLILISDTNQIVSLIAQYEEVPFIFEKSANFLKYILIDEFQDTSSLQWNGILPLLLEVLQQVNGLVLLVGDPKQSIYRWRGGRMELIIDGIAPDLTYHWEGRKDIPLIANYRSAREIVEFNNNFFATLRNTVDVRHALFKDALSDVEQEVIKTDKTGYVQCRWLEKKEEGREGDDVQLEEVLQTIRTLQPSKRYSDIAILTRTNTHGAAVANYLKERQIPVVSAESLLLQHHLPVKVLVAAMEYIQHPDEPFYAVKLNYLFASFCGMEHPEAYLQKKEEEPYFFERQIPGLLPAQIKAMTSVALTELVFTLMHLLGLDVKKDNYIGRFQDVALQHSINHSNALSDFLDYWNEQKDKLSIVPPEGLNAVKIYTIHKSKGLQFPVVIVPYADWSMKPKSGSLIWLKCDEPPFNQLQAFPVETKKGLEDSLFAAEYHEELNAAYIDNINLLYVAFTRAEEQLYIFSTLEKKQPKDEPVPQNVSRLLKTVLKGCSLPSGLLTENEFTYGKKTDAAAKDEALPSPSIIPPAAFNPYREHLKLKQKESYNEALLKGELLHAVLSKISRPQQLEIAVATTVTEDVGFYSTAAQKVVDIFIQQGWFAPEWLHLGERTIWYNQHELRPDKLLLSKDECIIVDYKTGAKKTEYIQKMKEYINAYASIHPQKISAYLIYIELAEVIRVESE